MRERKEAIEFCLGFNGTYEDYPFHDFNWTVDNWGRTFFVNFC